MIYLSTAETAKRWNISARRVAKLASEVKIKGAAMVGGNWMIPETASKPEDGRKRTAVSEDLFVFPDLIYGISSKDDPGGLPPDEKQLYDGITLFRKTEYAEYLLLFRAKEGYSIRQIAELGNVSISTVKQQLGRLYKKTGVKNKKELVEKYSREMLDLQANLSGKNHGTT